MIAVVLAAFNRVEEMFGVPNPIKGLKKPKSQPRLASLTPVEEQALYDGTEPCFGNFLFAAIHTGLRPFCELAQLTADEVEESERGMMWQVYSPKTKKSRKIPVRPDVAELTRKLIKTAPKGSGKQIFRNTKDKLWKRMSGVVRFIALKKKLGWDKEPVQAKYSCYTCRHTFEHRMIDAARAKAVAAVNTTLAELYWSIGENISQRTAADGWGKGTVEELARYIQQHHPNARGYSASNLWRMIQFFETYRRQPKLATLLRELSWSHNLAILGRCKRLEEREFYLQMATRERWSFRQLQRQLAGA